MSNPFFIPRELGNFSAAATTANVEHIYIYVYISQQDFYVNKILYTLRDGRLSFFITLRRLLYAFKLMTARLVQKPGNGKSSRSAAIQTWICECMLERITRRSLTLSH
jgi:hypothetical protein